MGRRTLNNKKSNNSSRTALGLRLLIIFAVLITWELIARNSVKIAFFISYPSEILLDLIDFVKSGDVWMHTFNTIKEAYLGLLYGTIMGVFLGVILSQFKTIGKALVPIISVIQSIPQLTLAPLYILWFGIGLTSKVVLSSLMVFFNVFFSTYNAIKNIDQKLIETSTLLGASKTQNLLHIVIPCSMPWIMSGVRIGANVCVVGAIIGEYIGASKGLGWMVTYASSFFEIKRVMSCILILMIIGFVVTYILELLESYLLRWRQDTRLSIK